MLNVVVFADEDEEGEIGLNPGESSERERERDVMEGKVEVGSK